ncbi:hypothetical protein JYU34_009537 [Plutella xylostella]|uniref:Uncharacterized protein n=1 Tax=Plutella xylostella TaxID=51655 RepID=A0ABQ7QMW3_PLUXY|nr:hypothetical protein JYU34_009537 [Plutella xylostella]
MNYETVISNDKFLFALNQASTSVYMIAMIASVIQARFFDFNKASEFYMKLQEIGNIMKMRRNLIAKLKYLNGILKSECAALVSPCGGRGKRGGWWYPRDALVQRWVLEDKRALSDSDVTLYLKEIFKGYKMFSDVFKFQFR